MSAELKYNYERFSTLLVDHMSEGKSYASFAAVIGVKRNTLYKWENKYPQWKEIKAVANDYRLLWVEENLIGMANGTIKGQAAAAIFYAKNACPDHFKDKREVDVGVGITYLIDTGIPPKQVKNIVGEIAQQVEQEEEIEEEKIEEEKIEEVEFTPTSPSSVEDLL